ncbi:restriction endonuclease [Ramlibacter sp.]|uniref:restriction endonuclease n=1 Tax=Ramlibacter sp. TaxID=1917967 RepID=UPI002D60E115|nr:restriction endonuclease [Ramlibacter sp.]HYD76500.1 restriction endonuclease [Ramlibacter sp.]
MARRRRQSTAEDVVDLVALLPWWAGVTLALVSYLVLHRLAIPPKVTATQPGQIADLAIQSMVAGLATAGQYLAPFLCMVAALISFLRRRKRKGLVTSVAGARSPQALHGMSWTEFELLVGEAFRQQGYTVTEVGGGGADGGVDLVLRKGSETYLVQCKQWKATQVGVHVVRELFGVMVARGAAGAFVVTSGGFSSDARAFAEGRNITLVDGPKLFGLIQQAKASSAAPSGAPPVRPSAQTAQRTPDCPKCKAPMVRRTAKNGPNAGSHFWGCSRYPSCRGTR